MQDKLQKHTSLSPRAVTSMDMLPLEIVRLLEIFVRIEARRQMRLRMLRRKE